MEKNQDGLGSQSLLAGKLWGKVCGGNDGEFVVDLMPRDQRPKQHDHNSEAKS